MTVLIDAGNSRFKWARLTEQGPLPLGSRYYGARGRAGGVIEVLAELHPSRILVASVLGEDFELRLRAWASSNPSLEIEFIKTLSSAYGIQIAYAEPGRLGVDRFVALVAANTHLKTASVIIDCGTAVTVDALTSNGRHLGGLILPGLGLMRSALVSDTHRISLSEGSKEIALFARDTGDAVLSGTLRSLAAAIDRIGADMEAQLNEPVTRILSGGDAESLMPLLRHDYLYDPLLILKGLTVFAQTGSKEPVQE
ncbi:MAG: type III pantothenate kinase [Pseudomonadota bacterium]